VLQVRPQRHSAAFLNERDAKGRPRWLGTMLMEATIPQLQASYPAESTGEPVSFASPLVFELDQPSTSDPRAHLQLESLEEAFRALTPAGGWDLIVGVDSGGDVFGGLEDARDYCMLEFLAELAKMQEARGMRRCRFELVVAGLCIDGENTFEAMNAKLAKATTGNAFLRRQSAEVIQPYLEPVTKAMEPNKTPRILLAALAGALPRRPPPGGTAPDRDALGFPLGAFVQLPPRHHQIKEHQENQAADRPPEPVGLVIPQRWADSLYFFDGQFAVRAFHGQ